MAPQGTQGSGFMDLGGGGPNLRRPSPGARRSANIYALRAFAARSANKGALDNQTVPPNMPCTVHFFYSTALIVRRNNKVIIAVTQLQQKLYDE